MHEITCRNCKSKFQHDNPNAQLCFNCTTDEIIRLREQEEIIEAKLIACPEISDLLEKLSTKNILDRLRAKWYFPDFNPSINPEQFQER